MTPVRTCIGCGRRDAQDRLVRIALADGRLALDPDRRTPGRGGYLHRDPACGEQFVRRRGPIRSLRHTASREERVGLTVALGANGGEA